MTVGVSLEPQNRDAGSARPRGRSIAWTEFSRQFGALLGALRRAPNRRRVLVLVAATAVVIVAIAAGQVRLNAWQGDFYDALDARQFDAFLSQLAVFSVVVVVLVTLQVAQTWLRETLQIDLRRAITTDLLDEWLQPRHAYLLGWSGEVGRHPDQRIQEDSRHLCQLSAELGVGLLQASLLLVSFIGVLWLLSDHVALPIGGRSVIIPGYMVWCALAYAVAGSAVSWRVGRPLVAINAEHYAREADFRFALVHVSEAAEAIGLGGGERDAHADVDTSLDRVLAIRRRIARGLADLTWVSASTGWIALVFPIVVAAPGYFGGTLSFGELMMVTGAFLQVHTSLRWFVENFAQLADWRATLRRVMVLRLALLSLETTGAGAGRIGFGRHPEGHLAVEALSVALRDRRVTMPGGDLDMCPGDRVLITGGPGSGKSMLFRAVAGLWPWGNGQVLLPQPEDVTFLPQRPYVPMGSLRRAVSYPAAEDRHADAEVRSALGRVGLEHLLPHLDRARRWDKELALDELQSLAFARMLLRRPAWVVMDEPLSALDPARRAALYEMFDQELAGTSVLAIGRSPSSAPTGCRVIRLDESPGGTPVAAPPAMASP